MARSKNDSRPTRVTMLSLCSAGEGASPQPIEGSLRRDLEAQRCQEQVQPRSGPKSQVSTYEAVGQGYRVSVNLTSPVRSSGPTPRAWMAERRRSPATTERRHGGCEADRRRRWRASERGKVTTTQRNVVAADGQTRTVTTTGTERRGLQGQQRRHVREAVSRKSDRELRVQRRLAAACC